MKKQTQKYFACLSYVTFFYVLLFGSISFAYKFGNFFDALLVKQGHIVKNIEVLGCSDADKQLILSVIRSYEGKSIISVPLSEIREKLLKEDWITEVSVIRKLPDTIIAILNKNKTVASQKRTE